MRIRFATVLLFCALFLGRTYSTATADWPQWRGPGRDGVAAEARLPKQWPRAALLPVWKQSLGQGYSAPVIVRGRLYVHSREGVDEVVWCLDAATGQEIWRYPYPAPYTMHQAATRHGPGPKATTTVSGGKVYAFGISSILTCLDAAKGTLLWQRDLKADFQADPAEYGTAGSPLIDGQLVVVPVGGRRGGSVMAFDKDSGKLAWKAVPGELPGMSSPIAANLAGVRQVLTFTENQFVGLDARTGEVLWSYPFTTSYRQNIVTPVVVGDMVIASGIGKYAFAIRVTRAGNKVSAQEKWKNRDLRIYMSSPVVVGEYVYGLGPRGRMACVNVKSGKTAWTGGDLGEYCSIVAAGDRLLVLDNLGQLTLLEADPAGYHELGNSTVSDTQTWAHLALVGSRIFVRDRTRLACIDLRGP